MAPHETCGKEITKARGTLQSIMFEEFRLDIIRSLCLPGFEVLKIALERSKSENGVIK